MSPAVIIVSGVESFGSTLVARIIKLSSLIYDRGSRVILRLISLTVIYGELLCVIIRGTQVMIIFQRIIDRL